MHAVYIGSIMAKLFTSQIVCKMVLYKLLESESLKSLLKIQIPEILNNIEHNNIEYRGY
jgi:hypothetical protein